MKTIQARLALTAVLFSTVFQSLSARGGQIIYVNQNANPGVVATGSNWVHAYKFLGDAFNAATNGTAATPEEIWIATGTYKPESEQTDTFMLHRHLRVLGGFKGNETNDTQRFFYAYATVFTGDIQLQSPNQLDSFNINTSALFPLDINNEGVTNDCFNVITASNVTDVVLDLLYVTGGWAGISTNAMSEETVMSMA